MKVGNLTVKDTVKINGVLFHQCICDCGKEKLIRRPDLIRKDSRQVKSCGCLSVLKLKERVTTHGLSKTRFYRIWANMIKRIDDPNCISYKNYGGRGIKVCNEWRKFINFKNDMYQFYQDHVKEYGEKETTIERINTNGNYELSNCKWATNLEQKNNQRRHRKFQATNVKTGETVIYSSKAMFARDHIVTRQHINKVLNGERKSTGGYTFKYID
jgi:PBP1b-binding outer membrane lipoprotein LpoB